DLDDDGIPVGAKVARVLVPLPDLELHRPDPVEKGGVIERLEHRGESRVLAFLSIEPGVRIDVVPTLAMLVALVLHGRKAARPKVVSPHPGLDRLVEVVPERAAGDAKPDMQCLDAMHGIDPHDFHRRAAARYHA